MIEPPPTGDRSLFRIMGLVIAAVVVATVATAGAVILARRNGVNITFTARPAATGGATASLRRAIEVRAGAAPDTAIVTRLAAGTAVEVLGRSLDATWVVVRLPGAPDVVGWVPADGVEGIRDVNRLAAVQDAAALAAAPVPVPGGRPPDLPDLRVEGASSRRNLLVASVVNDGPGDLVTPLLIAVNDGAPIRIETKDGEPLRAKQRVDAVIPGQYVQLRARVTLKVQTEPASREASTDNNTWTGIIEPDVPNNLGIQRAVSEGDDRHLVVTIGNASPIPVRGSITVTVREALPSTTLLGRDTREVLLEPGKTVDVPFPDVRQVDLTRIAVRLSTDAIHDDVLADDSYPR